MKSDNPLINDIEILARKLLDLSAVDISHLIDEIIKYRPSPPNPNTTHEAMCVMLSSIKNLDFEDSEYDFNEDWPKSGKVK